jgi:predicted Holliday junction resolvase-like endonuclease
MQAADFSLLIWAMAGALLLLAVLLAVCLRLLWRQAGELARHKELTDREGQRRVEKSRYVLLGQVAEHFAPLLPGFGYNPKDARFLGAPVDYLVFNGLNDPPAARAASGVPAAGARAPREIEIVFCEIKTGSSQLSAGEKAIREAVTAGCVRFETLRLGADGVLTAGG